jgi:sugar lactone lactonase YvrE
MPLTLTALADGAHTISIRARDAAGNVDASPAVFSWTVDANAPNVAIIFPPPVSYTDAATLTVRGTSADANGIHSISVNGVTATSTDGYQTWSAQVPLVSGQNTITVDAEDTLANATASAASAEITNRTPFLGRIGGMDYDAASQRLIVVDNLTGEFYAIDADGRGEVLASRADNVPTFLHSLAIDRVRNRALVLTTVTLSAIDLDSGARSTVTHCSNAMLGMSAAQDVAVDSVNNRAFIVMSNAQVAEVDLNTGMCSVLSFDTIGDGPQLARGSAIAYDDVTTPAAPRLFIGSPESNAPIIQIDVATGDRDFFPLINPGAVLSSVNDLKVDANSGQLFVLDEQQGALLSADLQTGTRRILGSASIGSGPALAPANGIAIRPSDGTVFTAQKWGEILSVDTNTLARQTLIHSQIGMGPRMSWTDRLTSEQAEGAPRSLLVTSNTGVHRLDLATGNRSIVSSSTVGAGPSGAIETIVLDTRPDHPAHAFGVMWGPTFSLVGIDLTNGNRELIVDLNLSSGTHLVGALGLDVENERLLFAAKEFSDNNHALYSVDLATRKVTMVSGKLIGSGPALNFPGTFVLEPASHPTRAIITNGSDHTLLSIDLTTGDRVVFSSSTPPFFQPGPLLLDSANASVLGVDNYGYELFSASLKTGVPQPLSGWQSTTLKTFGRGPMLLESNGLVMNPISSVAYATQSAAGSIIAIDVKTGDRVVISR